MTIPLCRVIDREPNKTCAACCPINGHRTLLVPCSRSAGSPVDAGTDHGEWAARIDVRGAQLSVQALAARGESLAAFDGRCIPKPPQRGCRVWDPGAPRPSRCDARLSPRAARRRQAPERTHDHNVRLNGRTERVDRKAETVSVSLDPFV